MTKNNSRNLILLMVVGCLNNLYAANGNITLTLSVPHQDMLAYEWESPSVTISNNSDQAVYILKDIGEVTRHQMVLDIGVTTNKYYEQFDFMESLQKLKFANLKRKGNLLPGESFTWHFPPCYGDLSRAFLLFNARKMTARFPVNDGVWIQSNTILVRFHDDKDKKVLFEQRYCDSKSENEHIFILYEILLGDRSFIFTSGGMRLCEIPSSRKFSIEFDGKRCIAKIGLPEIKKTIFYNLTNVKIWTKDE